MAKGLFSHYHSENLEGLIKCLNDDYYDPIILSCVQMSGFADNMTSQTENIPGNLYMERCIRMLEEIKKEVEISKYVITPYVNELFHKDTDGHNCSSCSGKCSINHKMQVSQIQTIHRKIGDTLRNIQQLEKPLDKHGAATDIAGIVFHNELTVLDNVITEMFYVEEEILMPKILEAQKHIHAQ